MHTHPPFTYTHISGWMTEKRACGVRQYRCCAHAGEDLNRQWLSPDEKMHPCIHHIKTLARRLARTGSLVFFCDFHGHSTKQKAFMYGCDSFAMVHPRYADAGFSLYDSYSSPEFLARNGSLVTPSLVPPSRVPFAARKSPASLHGSCLAQMVSKRM